jgi:hypothetical protein
LTKCCFYGIIIVTNRYKNMSISFEIPHTHGVSKGRTEDTPPFVAKKTPLGCGEISFSPAQ